MKVLEWITFRHPGTLQTRSARLKKNPSDTAEETLKSLKGHIGALDKQIEAVLTRVVEASNPSVIRAYKGKIETLERKS